MPENLAITMMARDYISQTWICVTKDSMANTETLQDGQASSHIRKGYGVVPVDLETLVRTPKSSYHALARALARNSGA